MKATVYRGTKEIGGTCIELKANNGKVLWIDIGTPLNKSDINIGYINNNVDAILISHPHQDHYGLIEYMGVNIPIYMGELSENLINAARIFQNKVLLKNNINHIDAWKKFTIEDTFQITPYLVDHSSPEAFAFLIEADNKRVLYSGDFRATGRKNKLFYEIIKRPPENIDYLFIEGTMVSRNNSLYSNEDSIEEALLKIFQQQQNVSFVVSSGQNIDRFVSVYRACKRSNKKLVIDIYMSWLLDLVREKSSGTPSIDWNEIKVYENPKQLEKINEISFNGLRQRVHNKSIGNIVFNNPAAFVYFVRCPHEMFMNKFRPSGLINIIYSQWEGYLSQAYKNNCTDLLNKLKIDKGIAFSIIHTSGHATINDLLKFTDCINPKCVVPIHTDFPELLKKEFESFGFKNVILWKDCFEYQL